MRATHARNFWGLVIATVVGSSAAWPVQAAQDRTTGFFVGTIQSVEVKTRTLKVKNEKSDMTFIVATDAKIIGKARTPIALGDLKNGDQVTVDYSVDDNLVVAHAITVKELTPPQPPDDKPPPL